MNSVVYLIRTHVPKNLLQYMHLFFNCNVKHMHCQALHHQHHLPAVSHTTNTEELPL